MSVKIHQKFSRIQRSQSKNILDRILSHHCFEFMESMGADRVAQEVRKLGYTVQVIHHTDYMSEGLAEINY